MSDSRPASLPRQEAALNSAITGPVISPERWVWRYGAAVLLVMSVAGLRYALAVYVGREAPLLPFILPIFAAAYLGGRGPATLALILTPLLVTPLFTSWPNGVHAMAFSAHVGFFGVISGLVILIMGRLQAAAALQRAAVLEAQELARKAAQSEQQLRLIADALPVLISYVDRDHRYRFNNRRYEQWFGVRADEIQGKHARDVIGAGAYEVVRSAMETALAGEAVRLETVLPSENGDRHIASQLVPDLSPENIVRGYFAVTEDVTERKRVEQTMLDMQRSLSLALRAGRAGSFDWNVPAERVFFSDEQIALYGFAPGAFEGTFAAWLACVHEDDVTQVRESVQAALRDGEFASEFRIRRRDNGEIRWIHARGQVLPNEVGSPQRVLGINADVTELKQAEAALQDRERMLNLIYHNVSDCLYLVQVEPNDQFRFISVNETFLRVTGYSREQAEQRPMEEVVGAGNDKLVRAHYRRVIETREPVLYTETAQLPAGDRVGEITLIPIIGPRGSVDHILGAIKDVTGRKVAEWALVEADRRKDEFLAMLAHELRNPLAPIRTIAHVLKNERLDSAAVRRNSEALQRQAEHLTRLVDDLLDVARITRGNIQLNRTVISLQSAIDSAIEMVRPLLALKHQTVNSPQGATATLIEGDTTRLTQVFGNLLSNAVKFSPERALIELRVEERGDEAIVRVLDTGVGIPQQALPHIFDLFMQGDQSLDRRQGGIGVGLTIVKRLVEMHGGHVEAHSAGVGQGSEFVVYLPIAKAAAPPPEAQATAGMNTTHSLRILVVDDNSDAAESIALLLELEGHQVRTTHDGATALAALETFDAQVVLLDIGLPEADGYTVARAMRERFPDRRQRLYALTGYGSVEDRSRALASGFDGHLTKPVDPERLLQLIADPAQA